MPWLCNSRKKQPERSKFIIGDSHSTHSEDDNVISNGQPIFTVVLQDFEASVNDELSIQRGQVLEALYTDDDWLYVRNVDGNYGYVPDSFCYRLEQMTQWSDSNRGSSSPHLKLRPQSIAVDVTSQARSSATSVEVHTINQSHTSQPRSSTPKPAAPTVSQEVVTVSTPLTPRSTNRLSGMPGRRSPGDSPELARSSRSVHVPMRTDCEAVEERYTELPPCTRSMVEQPINRSMVEQPINRSMVEQPINRSMVEQPINRSMVEQPINRSMVEQPINRSMVEHRTTHVRRSVSMNRGTKVSFKAPLRRTYSYQEAMLAVEDNKYGLVADVSLTTDDERTATQTEIVSHDQPTHNVNFELNRSHDTASRRSQFNRMNSCPSRMMNSDLVDDVFFETRKPLGIYCCLQAYTPRFKGEIALRENELVILSDYGRGDWAWITTSAGMEGLIPKHQLVRYSPELGVGGARRCPQTSQMSDAMTQTELMISEPVRQVSSASSASVGPSAGSSNSSFNSHNSPSSHKREVGRIGGDGRVERVMASSAIQTSDSPTPWFENVDSLERPLKPAKHHPGKPTKHPTRKPTEHVPKLTSCPAKVNDRPAKHSVRPVKLWRDRPPKLDTSLRRHTLSSLPPSSPGPLSSPGVLPSPCVLALGPDTECDNVTLLHCGGKPPVLTATRDYTPPTNAKNCLSLKKGDVLVSQPHMHYPRGWMWVWHSTQRTFGYIPKACAAYAYNVTKTNRQRTDTVEDAV